MDEKEKTSTAQNDALFDTLKKNKARRKKRVIRTVLISVVIVAAALVTVVLMLQRRVRQQFASTDEEVLSYTVKTGSVSTTVSGSGTLTDDTAQEITVPAEVEVTEVFPEVGDTVKAGDLLATVDMAGVVSAMSAVQAELDALDDTLSAAAGDKVSSTVSAGVAGRVKKLYAAPEDAVADCMAENGALALLSLDGYMSLTVETDALSAGDAVTVLRADGSALDGTVEKVLRGQAVILVTDNGPEYGEAVTVTEESGETLGEGELEIHEPLRVTGYAGTVYRVTARENQYVYAGTTLLTLTDTKSTAAFGSVLGQRREKEELLLELLSLYRAGALYAPYDGIVSTVDYDPDAAVAADGAQTAGTETAAAATETLLLTLAPGEKMTVTLSVDETDILALELGQTAEITVDSVGEDVFTGTVTAIDTVTASTSTSGVTRYAVTVTLPRQEKMLSGMTAAAVVRIEGVENALIIPADALHETSDSAFVYTTWNAETQEYGGMTEVTAGLSNSSYVEITQGLSEGDVVYYTETEEESFFGGMSFGGQMSDRGDMPSGGGMPSGGSMPGGMPGR